MDAQVERDAQLQAHLQADEEAKAAHSAKKRETKELEAAHHAFADIPLGTEQERVSDEEGLDEHEQ